MPATNSGVFHDYDDSMTIAASQGTITDHGDGTWSWTQTGDEPDYDAMLDYFPVAFHEPYYASYLREDLDRLWSPGFTPGERVPAYFSKVLSYRREL